MKDSLKDEWAAMLDSEPDPAFEREEARQITLLRYNRLVMHQARDGSTMHEAMISVPSWTEDIEYVVVDK